MVDHGVFNCKVAAGGKNRLIVRRGILARIGHGAGLHGGFGRFNRPIVRLLAAEGNAVDRVKLGEVVHCRSRHKVDAAERLLQNRHVRRYAGGDGRALGHEQERLIVADRKTLVSIPRVGDGKLRGIAQRECLVEGQIVPRDGSGRLGLRRLLRRRLLLGRGAGAERQQQRGKERQNPPFHSAALSDAEAKFSVYSISCGVLIAVVSPTTVRSVSKAATGISNVEPGSVERTS